jgi:hypothetical protein
MPSPVYLEEVMEPMANRDSKLKTQQSVPAGVDRPVSNDMGYWIHGRSPHSCMLRVARAFR